MKVVSQTLDAKCVYVLAKKGCSSKHAQISWYFRNFNEVIAPKDKKKSQDEDDCFEVLSAIQPDNITERRGSLVLSANTQVTFISHKYSLVFVLHCNPSLATTGVVSNQTGVIFSSLCNSLKNVLKSLAKPFCIPGTTEQMCPEIHFSILVFTSISNCPMKQVLIHGSILSLDTIDEIMLGVEKEMQTFESNMATAFEASVASMDQGICHNRDTDSPVDHFSTSERMDSLTNQVGDRNASLFILMLRQCLLTLKLLRQNSATGIVILTDGTLGMPNSSSFDIVLQQLRCDNIAISFVQLKEAPTFFDGFEKCFFGHIPNVEFMQFISVVTGGTYFNRVPRLASTGEPALTATHRGILCRDLFRCEELHPGIFSDIEPDTCELSHPSLEKDICIKNWQVPLAIQNFVEFTVTASVMAFVSCRIKEGYLLRKVSLSRGEGDETRMAVKLSYPWRYSVYIHYQILSIWTGPHSRKQTHLTLLLEAPSKFISDMTLLQSQNIKSTFPRPTLKRCLAFLKNTQQTDKLLAHLRLFASNHNFFVIPDGLRAGKPLLLPHDSVQKEFFANPEVVNTNTSEFHHFWKQMATVEVPNWQKWFDVHTLEVLMEHDEPMSRHVVSSASRIAHCRRAQEAFHQFLQKFTSFVLVEKTTYIGIVFGSHDKGVPISYYVLKVEARPLHFVIHVGFIGDKCFSRQMEVLNQLRMQLGQVKIDQQSSVIPVTRPLARKPIKMMPRSYGSSHPPTPGYQHFRTVKTSSSPEEGTSLIPPMPLASTVSNMTINCCHVLKKSIDKIQIIYDKVPHDYFKMELVPATDDKGAFLGANSMAANVMTTVSTLLHHHRWVWSLKEADSSPSLVTNNVLDRILYNIIRLRLDEGFHFIGCSLGIIRMAAEFEMLLTNHPNNNEESETTCIVQFIIFPPSSLSRGGDGHLSDAYLPESSSKEEGLNLIMECWVEPQSGVVCGDDSKIRNFIGLQSHEIPHAIYAGDKKCISAFVTLEKFIYVCQHPESALPFIESGKVLEEAQLAQKKNFFIEPSSSAVHLPTLTSPPPTNHLEHHIDHLPFPFDPIALTAKCQQVELTFSLFSEDRIDHIRNPPNIFPVRSSSSSEGSVCPNSLVLLLFNEQLKRLHTKDFDLPHHDCLELINSLMARERDLSVRPLPFCYVSGGMEAAAIKMTRPGESPKSDTGLDFSPPRWEAKKGGGLKEVNFKFIPRWKCYLRLIKSTSSSGGSSNMSAHPQQNLIITIVPATYEDILKLNRVGNHPRGENLKNSMGTSSEGSPKEQREGDRGRPNVKVSGRGFSLPDNISIGDDNDDDVAHDGGQESRRKEMYTPIRQSSFDARSSQPNSELNPKSSKQQSRRSTGQEGVTFATPSYDARSEVTFIPEHPPSYWCGPVFPVYVYNCSTATFSDLLLNLRTTQKIPDLYEDLTFEDDFIGSHPKSSVLSQSPEKVTCLISSSRKVSECESTSSRDKWRRAGEDLYKNQDDLKQHSTLISETYLRCFVSALYESLRSGRYISKRDVDAAIYNVCEESRPVEIDVTEFLRTSCKQIQMAYEALTPPVSQSSGEVKESESCGLESPQLVTMSKLLESHVCDSQHDIHDIVKARFLDIISQYFLPVASHPECLFCCETMRHREALESLNLNDNNEDSISEAADKLIGMAVEPSEGDMDSLDLVDLKHPFIGPQCRGSNTTPSNSATMAASTASDDQYVAVSQILPTPHNPTNNKQHSGLRKTDLTLDDSSQSDNFVRMLRALKRAKACNPLFLHLTLSIRLGDKFFSTQVDSLPVCGADLKTCLQDIGDAPFDGGSFKVTLDILCLSLGIIEDLGATKDRPCYSRLTSINGSQRSTQTGSSDCEDDRAHEEEEEEDNDGAKMEGLDVVGSFGSSERNKSSSGSENLVPCSVGLRASESDKSSRHALDCDQDDGRGTRHYNLGHLPKSQQVLVLVCRNLIKWLLDDEMVSFLRSAFPVTEANLERVTRHIEVSRSSHKMCLYTEVGLQFVFGYEKSLPLFIEQFEKMTIDHVDKLKREKFQLIKSGCHYYLCKLYEKLDSQGLSTVLKNFYSSNQPSTSQNRSSSMESSGVQKSETVDGQQVSDECPVTDVAYNDFVGTASTGDVVVKRPCEEAVTSNDATEMTVSMTGEAPMVDFDPNVQVRLLDPISKMDSTPRMDQLKKMASIGGIGNYEDDYNDDDDGKIIGDMEGLYLFGMDLRKAKLFFPTTQRASTPNLPGPESRRLSYSAVTTMGGGHPVKSKAFASQTITTCNEGPGTLPTMISRPFVAVSSSGDRYIKTVESFSQDLGEMRRVRPISGPPGLDGGAACFGPASLLAPSQLSEKDAESREDLSYASMTPSTSSNSIAKVQLIKRAQSSTGFEKAYPSPVQSAKGNVMANTAQQAMVQQPHRSRHTSGRDTPISAIDTSSITTGGYEADWSEIDDEGMSETTVRKRFDVPDFWQVLKVLDEKVLVYFHCREVKTPNSVLKWESVNREVVNNINKICHLINQKLLLKDLWETKICNPLLINEADEDVRWSKDSKSSDDHHGNSKKKSSYLRHDYPSDSDDELLVHGHYLAASTQFSQGHFKCSEQFEKTFNIHPRLKGTSLKASTSTAMTRLKSKLSHFTVTNRSNTYVIMDSTGSIFYACLSETTSEPLKVQAQPSAKGLPEQEEIKLSATHNSADLLSTRKINRVDEEPKNSPNFGMSDMEQPPNTPLPMSQPNLSSMTFSKSNLAKSKDIFHKIMITFYGICRPGKQITEELTCAMQKELDDAVLDNIWLMITRNPGIKLSIDDVHFIQKTQAPSEQFRFLFPTPVILHQHAFGVYLRQNLQNYLILPKYQDPNNPSSIFQPFQFQTEKLVPPPPPLSAEFSRHLPGSFQGRPSLSATSNNNVVVNSSSSSSLSSTNQLQALTGTASIACTTGCTSPPSDQDILLFVRPQHDGNKGIACIHLAFVDGKGHQVRLLGSPKPSPTAYKELSDKNHFEALFQVSRYKPENKNHGSKSPGPICLIQFSIWICGNIDLPNLSSMLEQSICHAIQDFVFEYRLLTAPISEVPFHYARGVDSPLHSAPVSPRFNTNNSSIWPPVLRSALPQDMSRTVTDLGGSSSSRVTQESTFFSIERPTTVTFDCDSTYMEEEQLYNAKVAFETLPELNEDLLKKIQKYEEGQKGTLNPIFVSLLPNWFNSCCKSNTPSVSKHQYMLVSFPAVELLLQRIPGIIMEQLGDVNVAMFREILHSNLASDLVYEPFEFCKDQLQSQTSFDDNPTSSKGNGKGSGGSTIHRDDSFIIVCRNVAQWRQSLDGPFSSSSYPFQSAQPKTPCLQSPAPSTKTSKINCKKFPAPDEDPRLKSESLFSPFCLPEKMFVPRQFIIVITCKNKMITMYQYNLSTDVVSNLDKNVMRHVYWHNARSHVLSCIASQKMGLFQHTHYMEPPPEKFAKEQNPFLLSMTDFDQLISHPVIPSTVMSQKMRNRSGSTALTKGPTVAPLSTTVVTHSILDHLYLDSKPSVPMHLNRLLLGKRDGLHRQGCQANQMKNEVKQETARKEKMQKLFNMCEGRNALTHQLTLSPADLALLKRSSRIIHQVMSPLLFSPIWQRESPLTTDSSFFIPTITTPKPSTNSGDGTSQFEKKRSRHSSGSSVRSKRSDSIEQAVKKLGGTVLNPPPSSSSSVAGGNQPTTTSSGASLDQLVKPSHHAPLLHQMSLPSSCQQASQASKEFESEWHRKICHYMMKQYINYLSPFYFYSLKVAEPAQPGSATANEQKRTNAQYNCNTTYMHKSLQGGLILVEVGFLPTHFYVTIYAFQAPAYSINTQLSVIFTDECDKIKDAIHLNSFCHDFHLRLVQTFVQNESSPDSTILPPHYPVTRYLREVVSYFPYEPNYSWNYVHEENMVLHCGNNTPSQLFEYMHKHVSGMKSISMNAFMSEEDLPSLRVHALMCPLELTPEEYSQHDGKFTDLQTFDIGLLLAVDDTYESSRRDASKLHLKFWIVLTNRYQIYPKDSLEKKKFPTSSSSSSSSSSPSAHASHLHSAKQCANPSRVNSNLLEKFRREQMDYLGYSNIHQIPLFIVLQPVANIAKERIEKMASIMSRFCYRDHLWMRLLVSDEESKRKRKTGEIEESKDPAMAKLSCSELKILLDLVQRVDLCKVDPRLLPILELPMPMIQQLLNDLLERFKTDSRYFTKSLDVNSTRKFLIILNPKALDICIMFTVEDPRKDLDGRVLNHQQPQLSLVIREEIDLKEDSRLIVRQHIENFVSIATYHLWAMSL